MCQYHKSSDSTYNLWLGLREQGEDGGTRVTAQNGDGVLGSVLWLADERGDKGGSSDNVKVGDTEESDS